MTDADDAGLLGAASMSEDVTDPADIAVLACEVERAKLEAEVERLRRENGVLRSMLYESNPCIHERIVAAREALAAGRAIPLAELDAALAQPEQDKLT